MKNITIPATELFDCITEEFIYCPEKTIVIEHSLVSLAKWESRWHKPFLTDESKTQDELIDYIRCMTITQNVDSDLYKRIDASIIQEISEYIDDPMTATTFGKDDSPPSREIVTAEKIYYWMIAFNIPVEFQKWHLNRLLTLIRVCNVMNSEPKKKSKQELYSKHAELNAARRKAKNTKG